MTFSIQQLIILISIFGVKTKFLLVRTLANSSNDEVGQDYQDDAYEEPSDAYYMLPPDDEVMNYCNSLVLIAKIS